MAVKLIFDPTRPASIQLKTSPIVAALTCVRYSGRASIARERGEASDGEPAPLVHVTPQGGAHRWGRHRETRRRRPHTPRSAALCDTRLHRTRARRAEHVRDLLEADLAHRMRRLAEGGLARLFADMRPWVAFEGGVLRVNTRCGDDTATRTSGLTLMPTLLFDRAVVLIPEPAGLPVLLYPAHSSDGTRAGAGIVSARRDWAGRADGVLRLLLFLRHPRTVDEMAWQQHTCAEEIRPHLAELSSAGLLTPGPSSTERYERTPVATALVAPSCPFCA